MIYGNIVANRLVDDPGYGFYYIHLRDNRIDKDDQFYVQNVELIKGWNKPFGFYAEINYGFPWQEGMLGVKEQIEALKSQVSQKGATLPFFVALAIPNQPVSEIQRMLSEAYIEINFGVFAPASYARGLIVAYSHLWSSGVPCALKMNDDRTLEFCGTDLMKWWVNWMPVAEPVEPESGPVVTAGEWEIIIPERRIIIRKVGG